MPIAATDAIRTLPKRIAVELPDFVLPDELPSDPIALKALMREQQAALAAIRAEAQQQLAEIQSEAQQHLAEAHGELAEAQRRINYLFEQFVLARRRMFGASSEQSPDQVLLFNEAEVLAAMPTADEDDDTDASDDASAGGTPPKAKARGKRAPLPAELPRIDVVHELPEDQRVCGCGTPMVEIGEEISEQLDIVPMKIQVLRHIRKRYGCPQADQTPVSAPMPAQPIPKSNASVDLIAMLLAVKFIDGLPLARFEKVLARYGVTIPRQTLARWVIAAANVLQPVHNLLRDVLFDGRILHMDETTLQVLKEAGRPATSKSYMWVQTGGPPDRPVVIYDYNPSRGGHVPTELLTGFQGFLMTDGYEAYNALARTEGIEHQVCWAHCRRAFVDAQRVQPKGKNGRADEALRLIGLLYRIERELKQASVTDRFLGRRAKSVPILKDMRQWLDKALIAVTPKSALGKALAYMDHYWPKLIRYVEWGDTPIDNNRCENAIRPFVVGRKGWLFSDTPAGAHASALIYSLVETAKANQLEPSAWLTALLRTVPGAQSVEQIEALLPWNLHPATLPRISTP
jgi:transposase